MVILHAAPLGVQIQRQRARAALAVCQFRLPGNDEGKARHTLNAFVGGADQIIDIQGGDVHGNAAEAAHGIDDVAFVVTFRQRGDLFDRVEHAGRGFAMHHGDMGDRRVGLQDPFDRRRVRPRHFAAVVGMVRNAHQFRHLDHARAVGAVADNQHFPLRADRATEHRFNRVAAAALQQH